MNSKRFWKFFGLAWITTSVVGFLGGFCIGFARAIIQHPDSAAMATSMIGLLQGIAMVLTLAAVLALYARDYVGETPKHILLLYIALTASSLPVNALLFGMPVSLWVTASLVHLVITCPIAAALAVLLRRGERAHTTLTSKAFAERPLTRGSLERSSFAQG